MTSFLHPIFDRKLATSRLVIVLPSQKEHAPAPNTATTQEDLRAAISLTMSLLSNRFQIEFRHDDKMRRQDLVNNLILICGDGGNSITKQLMRDERRFIAMKWPYYFHVEDKGEYIYSRDGKRAHKSLSTPDIDYGIIAKLDNPYSRPGSPSTVYLTAGIHGLGTWGAAHYLATRSDDLLAHLRAASLPLSGNFACVIKADRMGDDDPIVELEAPPVRPR